jgi:hypothetical protein
MQMLTLTPTIIVLLAGIFLLGGLIKGITGMGLPLVTVALGTLLFPVKIVLGISIIPIVLTNIWQVNDIGLATRALKRFWPMIFVMVVGLAIGAQLVNVLDGEILLGILGCVIAIFTTLGLMRPHKVISRRAELPLGLFAGGVAGLSGGLTTVWGPPITVLLLMTDLKKEDYIATVGLIWLFCALPLAGLYYFNGVIHSGNIVYSLSACVPAMAGMWIGQKIRMKIPQDTFRKVLLVTFLVIGINLIRRAIF